MLKSGAKLLLFHNTTKQIYLFTQYCPKYFAKTKKGAIKMHTLLSNDSLLLEFMNVIDRISTLHNAAET